MNPAPSKMFKRLNLFILFFLSILFMQGCGFLSRQLLGMEVKLDSKKVTLSVMKDSCKFIIPNTRLCLVFGDINPFDETLNMNLCASDNSKDLGISVYYNASNNNIYVMDFIGGDGEIELNGKPYRYFGKAEFYHIGSGKIEDGVLKPLFPKGTWFGYYGRTLFQHPLDYHRPRLTLHIPGTLKPAFVAYLVELDEKSGKREYVIPSGPVVEKSSLNLHKNTQ